MLVDKFGFAPMFHTLGFFSIVTCLLLLALAVLMHNPDKTLLPSPSQKFDARIEEEHIPLMYVKPDLYACPPKRENYAKGVSKYTQPTI